MKKDKNKRIEQQLFDHGEELLAKHFFLTLECIKAIREGRAKDPDKLVKAIEKGYQIIKDYFREVLMFDLENPPRGGKA